MKRLTLAADIVPQWGVKRNDSFLASVVCVDRGAGWVARSYLDESSTDAAVEEIIGNRTYFSYWEQGLVEWGSEPTRSKCKRRCYSFSTWILTKLFKLKEVDFFPFVTWRGWQALVVLQKLGKALVHSGDVTMNMCFFKVEKRWLYSSHCFPRGSCGSSGKALGYGLDGPGSVPGVGGVEISFTPSCPDCSWGQLSLL